MRIAGTGRAAAAGPSREAGRSTASGTGFRLADVEVGTAERMAASAAAVPLTSLDGLMALQAVPDATERRRRSARRGGRLLDGLAEIQLALLDGVLSASVLTSLGAELRMAREATDDPGLESVLAQIELRAAVELAKLEVAAVT